MFSKIFLILFISALCRAETTPTEEVPETTTEVPQTTENPQASYRAEPSETPQTLEYGFLPICKRNDPQLNECIKNATIQLQSLIVQGIPELKLPSLEPLKVPTIKLEQTTNKLTYKAVLMDVELHGLSYYEFTDIDVNIDNLTIAAVISFPQIYLDSEYMLMGKFESLPVEGSGRVMVNFTECLLQIKLQGGLLKKKDKMHFMNHHTDVAVQVGGSQAKFENLYSGSDDKSLISEHIINMHSEEILEELKPAIETVISLLFDDVTNKFFKNISFDKLFPE